MARTGAQSAVLNGDPRAESVSVKYWYGLSCFPADFPLPSFPFSPLVLDRFLPFLAPLGDRRVGVGA